jgi:pyruvate/2-oxoglutarate dehydrogenase complex dihydrolipoamide dehydrogenase (E3) component
MHFSKDGARGSAEAELAIVAIGWIADTNGLNLPAAGVQTDARGYVAVDDSLRTSSPHIYAAGDITGRWMLVPQAIQEGWVAASNAVRGSSIALTDRICPMGGFTEPEYARVGPTEAQARATHDIVVGLVRFNETARTIIDDRTAGFCKLLVERRTHAILGCHVVGERAVEMAQIAAIAMWGRMPADELVRIPLSFPTYTGVLVRAAYRAMEQLGPAQPGLSNARVGQLHFSVTGNSGNILGRCRGKAIGSSKGSCTSQARVASARGELAPSS